MLHHVHRAAALAAACAALCTTTVASAAVRPDPQLPSQWALQGNGPMGAATAWTRVTGGDVTVAVVDTGVDLAHRDLAPNLWSNPGEVPANGIDDDADGFVDDIHGADFVNHDADPADDNGHGTHVAGIIAARGNNGVGVAGLAWRARIMAVKVLGPDASGDMATVAEGVRYAVAHGARVINLSLTGASPGTDLADAVAEAATANVLVVAAAGNTHNDDDAVAAYPAALDALNLIAVTSSDQRGALAPSASFGRASVDLVAPGEAILSTRRGGGYELRSGSSMAAAQVSGAAVLLASARPDIGWRAMRAALLGSARPTSLPVAAGRLDVGGALRRVLGAVRRSAPTRASRARAGTLGRPGPHHARHAAMARAAVAR